MGESAPVHSSERCDHFRFPGVKFELGSMSASRGMPGHARRRAVCVVHTLRHFLWNVSCPPYGAAGGFVVAQVQFGKRDWKPGRSTQVIKPPERSLSDFRRKHNGALYFLNEDNRISLIAFSSP